MFGSKHDLKAEDADGKLLDDSTLINTKINRKPRVANCESEASIWSQLVFSWYTRLVRKASKEDIQVDDVFELDEHMKIDQLARRWKSVEESQVESGKFSLWRLVAVVFREEIFISIIGKIIQDLANSTNPIFIGLLVSYCDNPEADMFYGFALVSAFFIALSARSLVMNWYFKTIAKFGLRFQSCMTAAIYEKMLRISISAEQPPSEGAILNHAANDCDKVRMIFEIIPQFLGVPFMTCLNLFLLWRIVGPTACLGLIIPVVLGPFNVIVSEIRRAYQKRQLKLKDERLKRTAEVFSGIKVVKMLSWEDEMWETIDSLHAAETKLYRKGSFLRMSIGLINKASPFMASVLIFGYLTLFTENFKMSPKIAFVSLTLFEQISRWPLVVASHLLQSIAQGSVSYKRLSKFFSREEKEQSQLSNVLQSDTSDISISIKGSVFAWGNSSRPIIDGADVEIKRGELLVVTGPVGSGKSSLLYAVQGELQHRAGEFRMSDSVAFVPQNPWIINTTVRNNIIMDKPFDAARYNQVIKACALEPDFESLPDRDLTVIVEKGNSLSGGQRARISLARAIYQDRDVYLLDDPLAAVDAQVARSIYENVIGPQGMLADKTRLLVTQNGLLKSVDNVMTIVDGKLVRNDGKNLSLQSKQEQMDSEECDDSLTRASSSNSSLSSQSSVISLPHKGSRHAYVKIAKEPEKHQLDKTNPSSNIKARTPMGEFIDRMGLFCHFVPAMCMLVVTAILAISKGFWIKEWSQPRVRILNEIFSTNESRVIGYAVIGFSELLSLWIAICLLIRGGCRATRSFHRETIRNLMRFPLSFYHETSVGTISNIVGKEFDIIDGLWNDLQKLGESAISISKTVILIGYLSPPSLLLLIPMYFMYKNITISFIATITKLLRIESQQRARMFAFISETYDGIVAIRTHHWSKLFRTTAYERIDNKIRSSYCSRIAYRWLGIRIEALGNTVVFVSGIIAIGSSGLGWVPAASMAFVFTYSMNFSKTLNGLVRQYSSILRDFQSIVRIREISTPEQEQYDKDELCDPNWPKNGTVAYQNVYLRYKDNQDFVISDLNVNITSGEKIGVVGRTGAGKSSLVLSLFRLLESSSGTLIIDGVDIASIGLRELRRALTIIPQEPVLFSGNLRFNLDPGNSFTDEDLLNALRKANLTSLVDLYGGLAFDIEEGGRNLSAGERQLICLARALLRKSRILVLDEATASVDNHTDSLIQETIRREFNPSTVITVAHRLNTVMDYDRILVLDHGRLLESGPPRELMADENSRFSSLARHAGL